MSKCETRCCLVCSSFNHHWSIICPSFVVTFLFLHRASTSRSDEKTGGVNPCANDENVEQSKSEHQDTPEPSEQRPVTGSRQHAWCVSQYHRLHMELSSMCEPSPCTRVAVPALVPQSHRRRFLKKAKDLRGFELLAMSNLEVWLSRYLSRFISHNQEPKSPISFKSMNKAQIKVFPILF